MLQKKIVSLFVVLISSIVFSLFYSQSCDTTLYEVVEEQPEFPGGIQEMYAFLGKVKTPVLPDTMAVLGKYYVSFIIECDGSISNVTSIINEDHPVSIAYVEHVKKMPKWNPGKQNGIRVRVRYTLPIHIHWK
ncbi:MAG: energy transducer TonB [Flavobacteriales bacterium]|nr:energy transducer TonB [Flavobacteriales bacterium]